MLEYVTYHPYSVQSYVYTTQNILYGPSYFRNLTADDENYMHCQLWAISLLLKPFGNARYRQIILENVFRHEVLNKNALLFFPQERPKYFKRVFCLSAVCSLETIIQIEIIIQIERWGYFYEL